MIDCIDNYRDLPLGVYRDIIAANDIPDEVDRQVAVIALLTGRSQRDILNLPIADYTTLAGKAAFLTSPPDKLPRVVDAYRVGGFTLVPSKDLRKVTAAQYIDFQSLAPKGDAALPEILSCFLIPAGCKYGDGYDVAEVHAAVLEMSVADVLALSAFFLKRYAGLIRATRISLERMRKRERNPKRRAMLEARMRELTAVTASLTAGVGSPVSMP